jgi:hypothetical protein
LGYTGTADPEVASEGGLVFDHTAVQQRAVEVCEGERITFRLRRLRRAWYYFLGPLPPVERDDVSSACVIDAISPGFEENLFRGVTGLGSFVHLIRVNTTDESTKTAGGLSSGGFLFPVAAKGFATTLAGDPLSPFQTAYPGCERNPAGYARSPNLSAQNSQSLG